MNVSMVMAKGPDKTGRNMNLYLIEGHPSIYYPVSAALDSENVGKVFVATNDENIARIAEGLSCFVIRRPETLNRMGQAIVFSAREIVKMVPSCENIVILLGNNIMVSPYLIEKSLNVLEKAKEVKSVITVWKARHDHPRCALVSIDGFLKPYLEKDYEEAVYFYDGSVCAIRAAVVNHECFEDERWWTKLPKCVPLIRPWPTGRHIRDSYGLSLARWWLNNSPVDSAREIE
jgi:CMP-N-acetylneuraminic acid synthetase